MKNLIYLPLFLLMMLFTGCSNPISEEQADSGTDITTLQKPIPAGALSDAERASLIYMREEEKLARDVYITLFHKWNLNVFNNIAHSEQNHMETILKQLNKYSIPDPVISNEVGVFADTSLKSLYITLIEKGSASAEEALKVGIEIENKDITDLQYQLANVITRTDLVRVYTHLKSASEQHLKSFTKNLTVAVNAACLINKK